jgi:uncharacterized protein (DUF952 family)
MQNLFRADYRFALDPNSCTRHLEIMYIYKILREDEWAEFHTSNETMGAAVDIQDGFIHFSTAQQATETAAKHFSGAKGLMLLAFDAENLGDALKWESSRGGDLFPHLYGVLKLADMAWVAPLPLIDNKHVFPKEMV